MERHFSGTGRTRTADSGKKENTGKTVAFFAVSSDGTITVRKPNDYVSSMIDLAGGVYSLNGYLEEEDNALSTLKNADGGFLCGRERCRYFDL